MNENFLRILILSIPFGTLFAGLAWLIHTTEGFDEFFRQVRETRKKRP